MDWIIWLIVIVLIVGVVWWLLNRNNSRSSAGTSTSTGAGSATTPQAPPRRKTPEAAAAAPDTGAPPAAAALSDAGSARGGAEWETQWSETPPAEAQTAARHDVSRGAHTLQPETGERAAAEAAPAPARADHAPVHHPEYTEPHAPTLPGAETGAAELADAETRQAESSVAATEGSASHTAAPAGHLALEQPYGEGSAAPAPDGSGPEGFTVKGNASSMTYHDETSPAYEETRAEVWFLSAAHAEAAGFRPPRRSRL